MTNKEYVRQEHLDGLLNAISEYGMCHLCKIIGCGQYCSNDKTERDCKGTFEDWLNQEYREPLAFPIGTIVEVTKDESTWLGYYNGVCAPGVHKVCTYKENINKKDSNIPQGSSVTIDQIKQVGDYECNK